LTFLARPERWLWAIHRYHGTLSAAPNFAFELCQKRIDDADLEGIDLSSWRVAANGAEPVIPGTMATFTERFAKYGFRPKAVSPVYGLAESAVGLAFPPVGRGLFVDRIRRDTFTTTGKAVPAEAGNENVLEFPACGRPLPGHEIRVVDDAGRELPERREGRLQFRGPSCTSGYLRNPEATKELFDGDWLDSADYAYLLGGDIFLTGRAKDIIIKAGRNIHPQEIERAVGELDGVRTGCVAVFGSNDPRTGTERLVIMAETRETDSAAQADIRRRVEQAAADILGLPPDDVVLVPPQAVLKTSSGKVRRDASRVAYESGAISPRRRAVWLQVARLGVSTVVPELRRLLRRAGEYAFAGWWWTVLGLVAAVVWVGVTAVPHRRFGQGMVRAASRLILRLVTTPPRVEGLANLPAGPKVIVATHSSYMDAMVLFAGLPGDLAFAAKGEFKDNWRTGPFIKHIGSLFVERFEIQRSVEDTARLLDALRAGRTLVVFPEGTFERMPGLLPFRMGAFTVAAEAGVPVVPVAVRGTRYTLRSESWFPRRTPLRVTVCPRLEPEGTDWSAAIALRDQTRDALLKVCGEPDLALETGRIEEIHRRSHDDGK
jgi:1-acyl-sn-glycerol-3-phosphate acyltransferase